MKGIIILVAALAVVAANPAVDSNNIIVRFDVFGRMVCRANCGRANPMSCPPVNCIKPPADRTCPRPDCTRGVNRQYVFPTADPTTFYQCNPIINLDGSYGWEVLERPCGCKTYFSYEKQACIHTNAWTSDCDATPNPPPAPRVCIVECDTC